MSKPLSIATSAATIETPAEHFRRLYIQAASIGTTPVETYIIQALAYFKSEDRDATTPDIIRITKLSDTTISRYLAELAERGITERTRRSTHDGHSYTSRDINVTPEKFHHWKLVWNGKRLTPR